MRPSLSTQFFGLDLKSPVIAASSSLTGNLDQIEKIAAAGAGAVVLKSIFEEEIVMQLNEVLNQKSTLAADPEYYDYFDYVIKEDTLNRYIELIQQAKASIAIPVIASVSCVTSSEWTVFTRKLQEAGADALELNLFIIPSDNERTNEDNEKFYFETIQRVLDEVTIPVSIKISHYFSNLARMVCELSSTGIAGITLFNRFYSPDVDIYQEKLVSADVFSHENDYLFPLRWTGILSPKVDCPLAATSGIHSAETAIKFMLAGAHAVQLASVLYQEEPEIIEKINQEICTWMEGKSYHYIDDFRGKLSIRTTHAAAYERTQFMNYLGKREF